MGMSIEQVKDELSHRVDAAYEGEDLIPVKVIKKENDKDVILAKREEIARKKKDEKEIKKTVKEETKRMKLQEKEILQLKETMNFQKQKELKQRWSEQDVENTLKKEKEMKDKIRKKNEEIELNQRMHEEEAKKKAAKIETMQLKNQI